MKTASLTWDKANNPSSTTYDESYFSTSGAIEESKHVFLRGNDLEHIWQDKRNFVVAECGFGTGLNLLNTIELFETSANRPQNLYFISIENEPLCLKDLKKSHEKYPQLKLYATKLYEKYPPLVEGFHLINFSENIKILLCFYDVLKALKNLTCKVDSWFLDGFSPAKNSTMWSDEVFKYISHLSKIGSTATTYTVARVVKNGFLNHGFTIEKLAGFGAKKEMLKANCYEPKPVKEKPWFSLPKPFTCKEKKALIIGAGIAGCATAYLLAKHGWEVSVVDKNENAGMEASGNHCGVVAPLITKPNIGLGQMYQNAFLQSLDLYQELLEDEGDFSGVKHYVYNKAFENRWEIWKKESLALFTCKEDEYGKYFAIKKGGYLQPYKLCSKLLKRSKNITFHGCQEVISFSYKQQWEIQTKSGLSFEAPLLILALGADTLELVNDKSLVLQKIRGQVTLLDETIKTDKPLCDKGYVCPTIEKKQVIGATYIKDDNYQSPRQKDNEENLENIKKFLPKGAKIDTKNLQGRVSYRLSSNDRFPLIGAIHDEEFYKKEYKALPWAKHKPHIFQNAHYLPNLYLSTAHGSRGLVSAVLGANILVAMVEDLPIPLEKSLLDELHVGRFTMRRIAKQEVW